MTPTLEAIILKHDGIALNPLTGETFRLLGCAPQLVRMLKRGADFSSLLHCLIYEHKVDEVVARRDLDAFLFTLEQKNWIEPVSRSCRMPYANSAPARQLLAHAFS